MQRRIPKSVNGAEYWQCPMCKEWKPRGGYYTDTRTWNGIKSECRKCHTAVSLRTRDKGNTKRINREHMRRARQSNPPLFKERERAVSAKRVPSQKTNARQLLNEAVRNGTIERPKTCSRCGRQGKITAHHPDYDRPLAVVWLCYECHGDESCRIALGQGY